MSSIYVPLLIKLYFGAVLFIIHSVGSVCFNNIEVYRVLVRFTPKKKTLMSSIYVPLYLYSYILAVLFIIHSVGSGGFITFSMGHKS